MLIEIVRLVGASWSIFLDPPPPGHLEKVIQDFQFGLSDLHLLSAFYFLFFFFFFFSFFFFLILQLRATVTSDDGTYKKSEVR